jgi:hypothetical protein
METATPVYRELFSLLPHELIHEPIHKQVETAIPVYRVIFLPILWLWCVLAHFSFSFLFFSLVILRASSPSAGCGVWSDSLLYILLYIYIIGIKYAV